jgi:flagellar basal-body rod protein FlgC
MDYQYAFAISRTGMALEQARLETATLNLARINIPAPAGGSVFQARRVVASEATGPLQPGGAAATALPAGGLGAAWGTTWDATAGTTLQALGGTRFVVAEGAPQPARQVLDPGHPQADARGFVAYPPIDHNTEMLNLMTAVRAYEANVVALNAARSMAQRALEIGGNT